MPFTHFYTEYQLYCNLIKYQGREIFPLPFMVLLADLIIKLTQDRLTRRKKTNLIHTYRDLIGMGLEEMTKTHSFYVF